MHGIVNHSCVVAQKQRQHTPSEPAQFLMRSYRPCDETVVRILSTPIYDGNDWMAKALSAFLDDSRCFPFVGTTASQVVFFCLLRRLRSAPHLRVFSLEGGRLSMQFRGRGLGRQGVGKGIEALREIEGRHLRFRFLTSVDSYNKPSIRSVENENFKLYCRPHVWPHFTEYAKLRQSSQQEDASILQRRDLSQFLSTVATNSLSAWEQVDRAGDIMEMMKRLRQLGSSYLMPRLFAFDTAEGAADFMNSKFSSDENRCVWKLQRASKPVALLFYRGRSVDETDVEPNNMYSACVFDEEGAECCLAFADSRHRGRDLFRMAFDAALDEEAMGRSNLLQRLEFEQHLVYEKWYDGETSAVRCRL